jgi:hypothetical protein
MFKPWKIHTPVPLVSVIAPLETQMRVAIKMTRSLTVSRFF